MSLLKYEKVNQCEQIEDLANLLLEFADEDGYIHGRSKLFPAKEMAENMLAYYEDKIQNPSIITREYGFRQQAMYLKHYRPVNEKIIKITVPIHE